MQRKILIILGPTATGKTDLALKLAKKFNGELISADSRQVYVGLDIGTGKIPGGKWKIESGRWKRGRGCWEIDGVNVWLYDIADPKRQYNVSKFVRDAKKVIDRIIKKNKLPILVGGSGFYIKALTEGFSNLSIPVNKSLRRELEKLTLPKLQEKLKSLSLEKWNRLNSSDRQNPRRLLRSIELVSVYPRLPAPERSDGGQAYTKTKKLDLFKIGLSAPREILFKKVDKSLNLRLKIGMVEEAEILNKNGLSLKRMKQLGLEYGILADFIAGKIDSKNLENILKGKIHGYVRRQLTFFKKNKDINWFDITGKNFSKKVEKLASIWYHQPDAA